MCEENTFRNTRNSAGSWKAAVLPAIKYWNEIQGNQTCRVGEVLIKISGIKSGKDSSGNNVVNQIVFLADRDKIVCHL